MFSQELPSREEVSDLLTTLSYQFKWWACEYDHQYGSPIFLNAVGAWAWMRQRHVAGIVGEMEQELIHLSQNPHSIAEIEYAGKFYCEPTGIRLLWSVCNMIAQQDDLFEELSHDSEVNTLTQAAELIKEGMRRVDMPSGKRLGARVERELEFLRGPRKDGQSSTVKDMDGPIQNDAIESPSASQIARVREAMQSLGMDPTVDSIKKTLRSGGRRAFRDKLICKAIEIVKAEEEEAL